MSNALSIAAVTATLRNLLDQGLIDAGEAGVIVTTRPPDRARNGTNGNQVNLFLYHTAINPAWRNMDVPWRVKPGESGHPPLPLNLYYLINAYAGENEDDIVTDTTQLLGNHRLLGLAMSILHDHPVLHAKEIMANLPSQDQQDYPYDQVENVRITPQPLSLEEITKIWTGFQTEYRLSAAYEVSVVLIESTRPRRAPMPVLRRGSEDRGVETLLGPFPAIEEVRRPPGARYGFQLGDPLEILGRNLGGEGVRVRFTHPLLPVDQFLTPKPTRTAEKLELDLPPHDDAAAQADWAAGFYRVMAVIERVGDPARTSNAVPLSLSPRLTGISPNPAARDGSGAVTLTLQCSPRILPDQRARLLLGEREIPSQPHDAGPTDTLAFQVDDAPTGEFVLRLRVDGVDSLPLTTDATGLIFDPAQKVTIT
jgi:hypothetical protein